MNGERKMNDFFGTLSGYFPTLTFTRIQINALKFGQALKSNKT